MTCGSGRIQSLPEALPPKDLPQRRRAGETPGGDDGVADGAAERRREVKRQQRISIKVMQDIPRRMQQPADSNVRVRPQAVVREYCQYRPEGHFPQSKA